MVNKIKDFVTDRAQELADKAAQFRQEPTRAARATAAKSAERIKALKDPIRAVSRSGVKLTAISQGTAERLIHLQEQLVTAALTDAAAQLERAARAESARDLVQDQAEVLRATRERIVSDISQAVEILKDAGSDVRKVAQQTYAHVRGKTEPAPATRARRKAKAKTRRAPRKAALKK